MHKISRKTIGRALLYIRTLESLIKRGCDFVSSKRLADITGLTDAQIRKDISNFGKVGRPKIGYEARELKGKLEDLVLQGGCVRVVLFGVGNLGTAMLKYPGFQKEKIRLVAAFDKAEDKIGESVNGIKIYPVRRAREIIRKTRAEIGIVGVPAPFSQEVADIMVACGLRGIVNFAPASINVPKNVSVRDIDLTIEFLSLFYDSKV